MCFLNIVLFLFAGVFVSWEESVWCMDKYYYSHVLLMMIVMYRQSLHSHKASDWWQNQVISSSIYRIDNSHKKIQLFHLSITSQLHSSNRLVKWQYQGFRTQIFQFNVLNVWMSNHNWSFIQLFSKFSSSSCVNDEPLYDCTIY